MAQPNELYQGNNGIEIVTDTVAHAVDCWAIYFYESSVISAITVDNATGNSLASETMPQGTMIYGRFSSITLTSGACIMYKR